MTASVSTYRPSSSLPESAVVAVAGRRHGEAGAVAVRHGQGGAVGHRQGGAQPPLLVRVQLCLVVERGGGGVAGP